MLLVLIAGGASPAWAQSLNCDRMRADLASLDQIVASSRAQPYAESIRRQRADLDRTVAYARSIGCQRQRFIFFGDSGPAQCGQLEAQINRMESSLAGMEDQVQRSGASQAERQRAALAAAYDASCRGQAPQGQAAPARGAQPGILERLFGVAPEQDPFQPQPSIMDEDPSLADPLADPLAGGTYRTLCVRKCDGYYFPISPRATRAQLETDASLCQASCPAAETELFLQPVGQEANAAIAMDGTPYTSLPNAFLYRKAVSPGCGCRQPGQSWVEALGDAERMIGERAPDVVVSEQRAAELSRAPDPSKAKAPPPKPPAKGAKPVANAAAQAAAQTQQAAQAAAQVPTAGTESSGIGGSGKVGEKTVTTGQGETRVVATPSGKKTVRIVAPTIGPTLQENN
jgi:hypothetical protein